jgi:hypothetical protein
MNNAVTGVQRAFLEDFCKSNECAAALFDWAAKRKKDANFTSIERLSWLTNWEESEIRRVARALQDEGFCRFIPGRKGYKSRIEWYYSIRSMAQIALGEPVELSEIGSDVVDEIEEVQSAPLPTLATLNEGMALTIPQAKRAIALSLGIDPEKIEISIRA